MIHCCKINRLRSSSLRRCVVGLSGGVDSAVAALLMQKKGYQVIGCILKMQDNEKVHKEISDATKIAAKLGIQLEVLDCEKDFKRCVIDYFAESYQMGLTPNPCVICNSLIKFKYLNEFRQSMGAEIMATGHYARLISSSCYKYYRLLALLPQYIRNLCLSKIGLFQQITHRCANNDSSRFLCQAVDSFKDQSYFLYAIDENILPHTEFPLGNFEKKHVRKIAYENGLHVSNKTDSQDVCFISNGDYKSFLSSYIKEGSSVNIFGDIVDESGNVLGNHSGILNYTVGQRKGLKLAGGPFFVREIDVLNNRIIVSNKEGMKERKIYLKNVKFTNEIYYGKCFVKIRSSGKKIKAIISNEKELNGLWSVSFFDMEYAAAFGQHCVFYDGDVIFGGGEICCV